MPMETISCRHQVPGREFQLQTSQKGYKFYIHDDRYGTNELPESGLSKWPKERWIEKRGRLEMLRDKLAVERNGKRKTCYVNEARKAKAPPTHDKLESTRRSLEINC